MRWNKNALLISTVVLTIICMFHYSKDVGSWADKFSTGFWSFSGLLLGGIAVMIAYIQWLGWKEESEAHFKAEGASFVFHSTQALYEGLTKKIDEEMSKPAIHQNRERIERLKRYRQIQLNIQQKASIDLLKHYGLSNEEIETDEKTEQEIANDKKDEKNV